MKGLMMIFVCVLTAINVLTPLYAQDFNQTTKSADDILNVNMDLLFGRWSDENIRQKTFLVQGIYELKNRSLIALRESIRLSWEKQSTILMNKEIDKILHANANEKSILLTQTAEIKNPSPLASVAVASHSDKNSSLPLNWYVSAGTFKTRANAIALVKRLKELGFVVFLQSFKHSASVLVGPYEYRSHAANGMEKLKKTAHVQGVLISLNQETHHG